MTEQLDFDDAWQQLVVKAWSDPALKAKLLADPAGLLKANGVTFPACITVKVWENTDAVLHLVMRVKPVAEELSEEELHKAAGGRQNVVYDSDQGPNHDIGRLTGDSDPNDDRYT